MKNVRFFSFLLITLIFFSCNSAPEGQDGTSQTGNNTAHTMTGGFADEVRTLVETGYLSSMSRALDMISERNLGNVDFGRLMNGVITVLIRNVYPDSLIRLPALDLPLTYNYSRIIREAERGVYTRPDESSSDFLEHILPFTAINGNTRADILNIALLDTFRVQRLRPDSVFPLYYRALIYEYLGEYENAIASYNEAGLLYGDFYPASIGIARVMRLSGNREEAAAQFADIIVSRPDNLSVKSELALIHYESGDYSRAMPLIDELLQHNPRDGQLLLVKASILLEQGHYSQSNAVLDTYAPINPSNRLYLFLRARIQAEGNRNRDSAVNYLRSILRNDPDDEEALVYAAQLLMESQRQTDNEEGRTYLRHLLQISPSSIHVLNLGLRDAVSRESWQEAQGFLNRILAVRRTPQDLLDGYYIENGLRNFPRALAFARELYERDTANNNSANIYIAALIDNGRRDEASRLIASRLAAAPAGPVRSRLYFLRSRLQTNDEALLSDLRSSLFEDPRNLEAHIAFFEYYHRNRDERRAVQYLRQALAISPNNPRLRQYEAEYAHLLGGR